jgi:hypothetical protein
VARTVANTSSATYENDVLLRKLAISLGNGQVHGSAYDLSDWGLAPGESPANVMA